MKQLLTRWGENLDKTNPLAEYPRPSLMRKSWLNLNGSWQYAITKNAESQDWQGEIIVPFSPEAALSGVKRVLQPDEYLHYKKVFFLPQEFEQGRVLLHFGAVDQICTVFLNNQKLGGHVGGYLPFAFDITDKLIKGENTLTLSVLDKTEQLPYSRGKQRLSPEGKMRSLFYTPQSGIWKTVWLESVPDTYIKKVKLTPLFDENAVEVTVTGGENTAQVIITAQGTQVAWQTVPTDEPAKINIENVKAWCPDDPFLYDVRIISGKDEVKSYFGMRKFSYKKDKNGILRFYLNDEPFFFNGVLDQGYWPDGLMTPPSDEALIYDIQKLKALGYNTIRKHIKIESERFYYHCDRLGMAVWQDMPNGGGDYDMVFVTYLPNALTFMGRKIKDGRYKAFCREDAEGRRHYYEELAGMVQTLYHYPCIGVWVPFNEGWGQFDAKEATKLIRSIDNTRLVNEACGWFDQQGGDIYSIHNYLRKLKVKPQQDRVVALTEYGGHAFPIAGHMATEKEFGYRHYRSKEELTQSYLDLWEKSLLANIKNGLSAAIYTQTSDVEEEINGLMTYDRAVDKMDEGSLRRLNQRIKQAFEELV